jgi:hypothetical protein
MTTDKEVFLGYLRPQDIDRYKGSPLVGSYDGRPSAVWRFGDGGAPHLGAWGTTGGGKSSLLRMVNRGLVRRDGPRAITLIDAEGAGEFNVLRHMPGVASVINVNPAADALLPKGAQTSVEAAAEAFADHVTLSTERALERDKASAEWELHLVNPERYAPPTWYVPPDEVFIEVDGWATFCRVMAKYLKAKTDPVENAILLGTNGRKNDVHFVLADQVSYASRTKDDAGLPSPLKKQFGIRIAAVGPLGITGSELGMIFDQQDVQPPSDLGGCMLKVGASMLPFVVPPMPNAADPNARLTPAERRAAFELLAPPVVAA